MKPPPIPRHPLPLSYADPGVPPRGDGIKVIFRSIFVITAAMLTIAIVFVVGVWHRHGIDRTISFATSTTSPTGRLVYWADRRTSWFSARYELHLVTMHGTKMSPLFVSPEEALGEHVQFVWSKDGKRLLVVTDGSFECHAATPALPGGGQPYVLLDTESNQVRCNARITDSKPFDLSDLEDFELPASWPFP